MLRLWNVSSKWCVVQASVLISAEFGIVGRCWGSVVERVVECRIVGCQLETEPSSLWPWMDWWVVRITHEVGWSEKGGEQLKGSNLWIWKGGYRFWGTVNVKDIDWGLVCGNVEGMLQSCVLYITFWEVPATNGYLMGHNRYCFFHLF